MPRTLADDGDELDVLDVLVMLNDAAFSGCLIEARDGGRDDFKLLAVPDSDALFAEVHDLDDVPRHFLREVEHFFATYEELEGVEVETQGWAAAEHGRAALVRALAAWREARPYAREELP